MTVYSPALDTGLGLRGWAAAGASDMARRIQVIFNNSLEHYLEPRMELLVPEIENLLQSSEENVVHVDPETVRAATQFAYSLPRFAPLPEVSADPDGEISFDWNSSTGRMFSVSVNRQNRLAYAGWFGERSRVHGIEQVAEDCPAQIVRGIEKTVR